MMEIINPCSTEPLHVLMWEKAPLIRELEQTVSFAERKCGDLMQQLQFFKEYFNKRWPNKEYRKKITVEKKIKARHDCFINYSDSSSDYDSRTAGEKSSQKMSEVFHKKIRNKISTVNNKIKEANRKIMLKESLNDIGGKSIILTCVETTQSDPAMCCKTQKNPVHKKISNRSIPGTSNKMRSRSLQRYKIRSKSPPQGIKRKFGFGSYIQVPAPLERPTSTTSITDRSIKVKSNLKGNEKPTFTVKRSLPRNARSFRCKKSGRKSKSLTKITLLKSVVPSSDGHPLPSCQSLNSMDLKRRNKVVLAQNSRRDAVAVLKDDIKTVQKDIFCTQKASSLMTINRKPIPFTICASTSKSFNIGMNIQQVLSLIKHRKPTLNIETAVIEDLKITHSFIAKNDTEVGTLFFGRSKGSCSQAESYLCPVRHGQEDSLSVATDALNIKSKCTILSQSSVGGSKMDSFREQCVTLLGGQKGIAAIKAKRPEDVWVVEQPEPDERVECRRVKSRCTCFPTKHCVDYRKLLHHYTGWSSGTSKSDTVSTYTSCGDCRTRITMPSCARSNLYSIPSQEHTTFQNSGFGEKGGNCDDCRGEMNAIRDDFISLSRRCFTLQQQFLFLDEDEANAELDALESEIESRDLQYRAVIYLYNQVDLQLSLLKEQLRSLRENRGNGASSVMRGSRSTRDPTRPTPAMTLTKVLRHIQGLQNKIK